MDQRMNRVSRATVTALGFTAAIIAGVSTGLGNPDRLLATGYTAALESPPVTTAAAVSGRVGIAQLSGSEAFWLDHHTPIPGTLPATWTKPVIPGDRITLSTGASERVLGVVDVRPLSAADAGSGAVRLMLVTCRETGPGAAVPATLRLVIESVEPVLPDPAARGPHTL